VIVVAAVIEEDDRFFLTRRLPGVHLEGMWEFPGGKIDPAETHAAALERELREELDVGVLVGDLVFHTTHEYPDRTIALFFYRCTLAGDPKPMLGQEMRWVPRRELGTLGFPPADEALITRLMESDAR
jgi:8-oxo-dGTP diphosphatase